MAFKLFKNGDDLYADAAELIKRGEYAKARGVLQKSIDKEGGEDEIAAVMIALIDVGGNLTNPDAYVGILNALDHIKVPSFEFGLTTVDADRLRTECELTSRKLTILNSSRENKMDAAKKLQELAQDFQARMGGSSLLVLEIFRNDTTVNGTTEFFNLMAVSYELMSEAAVWEDPSKAAEYEQIAMGYRQQNGQSGEANQKRMVAYSNTCKCWLCGRIATGEGVHFYSAPSDVSPALDKDSSANRTSPMDGEHIYICRACYSAVSKRADEISKGYYDMAIDELRAVEARLDSRIDSLESQISMLRLRD